MSEQATPAAKPDPRLTVKPGQRALRAPRAGSKRERVLTMMLRAEGAGFAEVREATGWDRSTACEGIRLAGSETGHGVRTDPATGRYHAYPPEAPAATEAA